MSKNLLHKIYTPKAISWCALILTALLLLYHFKFTPSDRTTSIIDIESYPIGPVIDRGQIFTYYTNGEEHLEVTQEQADVPKVMQAQFAASERYLGIGITTQISVPVDSTLNVLYRFVSPPPYFQIDIEDGSAGRRGEVYSAVFYSPAQEWETLEIPLNQFQKNTNQFSVVVTDGVFDTNGIRQVAFTIPPRTNKTTLEIQEIHFTTPSGKLLVLLILGLYILGGILFITRNPSQPHKPSLIHPNTSRYYSNALTFFFLVCALLCTLNLYPNNESTPLWAGMYGTLLAVALADFYLQFDTWRSRFWSFRYFIILLLFIGLGQIPEEATLIALLIACYVPVIQRNDRYLFYVTTALSIAIVGLIGLLTGAFILEELIAIIIAAIGATLIAELQQLQKARAASERAASLYEELFEKSSDAIYLLDRDGVIQSANEGLATLVGIPREQLKGRNLHDFVEAGVAPFDNPSIATESNEFRQYELRLIAHNNTIKILLVNERTVFENDDPIGTQAIARDISAQKSIEEALRKSEQLYRDAIQVAGAVPYYYHFIQNRYEFIGDGIQRLTGYSSEEFSLAIFHSMVLEQIQLRGDLTSTSPDEPFWRADFRIRTRQGDERWISNAAIQVRDDTGQAIGVLGTLQDITERKTAEMELRRLATAIEQTGDMIAITDTNGIIQYVNPSFVRTSGYANDEIIGQRMAFHENPSDNERFFLEVWNCVSRGNVWSGRWEACKKDRTRYEVEATLSPLYDQSGAIYSIVAVMHDVTKEAILEAQLRQSQKMDAIGQLAGGVAHDFNNILAAILGFTENAMNNLDSSDPLYMDLEQVFKAGERAATLTRQLLTFSRRQLVQPCAMDLNESIKDIVKLLKRLLGEHIQLELQLDTQPALVFADKGEIEQVIMNLCLNARDAMPEGGKIIVDTVSIHPKNIPSDAAPSQTAQSIVRLSVTDTGCGIPSHLHDRIFEPFFTTKEMGTGLGLATVYGIVKRHNGVVNLVSHEQKGTTFTIDIPYYKFESVVAAKPASVQFKRGTETLLLAEDDSTLRKFVVRVLEQQGYTVIVAKDGKEAVQLYEANAERIQLLILDMIMPGLNGKKVLERIRSMNPFMPALFSTGYSNESLNDLDFDGTIGMIRKPFPISVLLQNVRELLDAQIEKSSPVHTIDDPLSNPVTH